MIKPQFLLLLLTTAFKWRTIKISWYDTAAGTTSAQQIKAIEFSCLNRIH